MRDEDTPQRNDPPQQQERLQTLNEISRVVASALDLRTLYETIYEQIGRVMDASQFFIALWRQGEDRLDIPYLREDGRLEVDQQVPYGKNVTSMVIDGGKELLYHTSAEYERYEREHGLVERIVGTKRSESGIFVPLITRTPDHRRSDRAIDARPCLHGRRRGDAGCDRGPGSGGH